MNFKVNCYRSPFPRSVRVPIGILAVCFYIVHSAYLVMNDEAAHITWSCHIASLGIGFGLICEIPLLVAIGVLWLGFGNIMWGLYLAGGGGIDPTSPLTHIGGLAVGIFGLFKTGIPSRSWAWALAALVVLQQVNRWVTPATFNINLAFRVHEGWEHVFPTYGHYLAALLIIAGTCFYGFEILLARLFAGDKTE